MKKKNQKQNGTACRRRKNKSDNNRIMVCLLTLLFLLVKPTSTPTPKNNAIKLYRHLLFLTSINKRFLTTKTREREMDQK